MRKCNQFREISIFLNKDRSPYGVTCQFNFL